MARTFSDKKQHDLLVEATRPFNHVTYYPSSSFSFWNCDWTFKDNALKVKGFELKDVLVYMKIFNCLKIISSHNFTNLSQENKFLSFSES